MNKNVLSSLTWNLVQRLYLNEIQFARYRKKIVKMMGEEIWRGELIPICQPRASGARNKHFFRELMFDGTPEEHEKYINEHMKQVLEGKKTPTEAPTIPEMEKVIRFIIADPNRKIQEETCVRLAIENFAIDFLSTVKAWSPALPEYAKKTFKDMFEKLFEDLYSDELTIKTVIPIFRFGMTGPRIVLREDVCIRRLKEYEIFSNGYLFPGKKSIPGMLSHVIEIKKSVPRDTFNAKLVLSNPDRELVHKIIDVLSLFGKSTVCSTTAIVINPYYEEEPVVALPLETCLSEADLALIIDPKNKQALKSFLKTTLKTAEILRTDRRLSVCFDFYKKSLSTLRFEYQLLNVIIGWEVLFGSFGRDTVQWVSLRAARLLGSLTSERPDSVLNDVRRAFVARNEFLHEGLLREGSESSVKRSMPRLLRYLRKSIACFLLLMTKMPYETVMATIDTAVQSPSVLLFKDKGRKLKKKLKNAGF